MKPESMKLLSEMKPEGVTPMDYNIFNFLVVGGSLT
jgi:hypothetical protein